MKNYKIPLPRNIKKDDESIYAKLSDFNVEDSNVIVVDRAMVNSECQIICDRMVLPISYVHPVERAIVDKKPRQKLTYFMKNFLLRRKTYFEKALWIVDDWSLNYFHWHIDALTRFFSLKKDIRDIVILLPESYSKCSFVVESLKKIGVTNVYYIAYSGIIQIDQLIVPIKNNHTPLFDPFLLKKIRGNYLNGLEVSASDRRIFVSRSKSHTRKILNEQELLNVLLKYGFECLHLEDISLDEQIELFASTKILVSSHGAGLTNCMFMSKGAKVFELRHDQDGFWDCYYRLSGVFELEYYYLKCPIDKKGGEFNNANLHVNIADFEHQLTKALV